MLAELASWLKQKLSSPTAFAKMDYNDIVKRIPESIVRWGLEGACMDPDVLAPIDYTTRGRWLHHILLAISEKQGQ